MQSSVDGLVRCKKTICVCSLNKHFLSTHLMGKSGLKSRTRNSKTLVVVSTKVITLALPLFLLDVAHWRPGVQLWCVVFCAGTVYTLVQECRRQTCPLGVVLRQKPLTSLVPYLRRVVRLLLNASWFVFKSTPKSKK